ncbi:D-ribose transporter subunit RbsB [Lysinibacillus contaminans]|uniref:D-ribose transporter subunit RbsB n=1 Tax=Lysinibacillus contaminans TaxID=1293441 RepID=A0ABR5K0M3_9BACI|nr:ribose ABC transporter substrate-binding protein RbsB [Lysinibacillus contaminans]KOS68289.1 D-ribose transporter subunit RbsB [Lysinibacillus contaminans]
MKKLHLLFAAFALVFVLAACSLENGSSSKDGDKAKSKDSLTIGLSISTLNNPFFVTLSEGAQTKADELGAKLSVADAQDNASKQASDVEDLIQQGVDLLLINPVDSAAVASAVEAANAAGIPVITVDRTSEGGEVVSHIASNNVAGGVLAGEYLTELVGKGAKIVELEGVPGSSAARDRGEGFNKAIEGQLKVVAKQTANFNRAEGLTVMENILQANPNVVGVFAHNDEMALGALEAIAATGKDIKVIGFDATDDAQAAVKAGTMAATVAQKPEEIGSKAIETAIQYLKDEAVDASIPVELELIKK